MLFTIKCVFLYENNRPKCKQLLWHSTPNNNHNVLKKQLVTFNISVIAAKIFNLPITA